MAGIYLHIPFCKQACHYCDFHFSTNVSLQKQIVEAISQELILQKGYLGGDKVETIYFGGGTPSLLSSPQLSQLLQTIHNNFEVVRLPEITLEANPDDINFEKFSSFSELGINRLSIGIQSFDDHHLIYLNRVHSSRQALSCIDNVRKAGIDNINIDLIYAIPSDNHDIWKKDLAQTIDLNPTHISSYCLTIENNTVFGNWWKQGKIQPIDEEHASQQFEILLDTLDNYQYEQYEISNFCLPKQYSKHNSNYWKQEKYLGVGPSAHSYNGQTRQYNISHNKKYIDTLKRGQIPFTLDVLKHKDYINEYLLTTLRTKWGADFNILNEKHNYDLFAVHNQYIHQLIEKKLAFIKNNTLILTNKGKLFADKIASNLFLM